MTLQKHLGNTGGTPEVTVYLEGWVSVEEVRIGASLRIFLGPAVVGQEMQHIGDDLQCMITVEHTCPEVDLPS